MRQRDTEELQQISRLLWNSEIWRVNVNIHHGFEKGYSPSYLDSLQLDFRQPLAAPGKVVKHRPVGSLWIDANYCGLRLERGKELVVAWDSTEKVLDEYSKLIGNTLVRVEITPPAGDSAFILENGMTLRCFAAVGHEGTLWRITSADNDELLLGPGARWSYRTALR
jgi:hypothetical protein